MYFKVLILVTGINHILGRPTNEDNQVDIHSNSVRAPPWPLEKNVYLLPTILNVNDMINLTIDVTKNPPKELSVSFMGEHQTVDGKSTNKVICSIKADFLNSIVTIYNEKEQPVYEDQIDVDYFFLDEDKTLFNMWIKRRENTSTEENNILEVSTKSYPLKPFIVNNINSIRYLKLSGENAKILNLDFKYA